MSGTDAVSAVTQTIVKLLEKRMASPPETIHGAPPDVRLSDPPGPKRLCVFLYRIEQNRFLANQDLGAPPGRYGKPPLSLDLHFLLTAYGSSEEDTVGAQQILGDAIRVLHDHPVIHGDDPAYQDVRNPALDGAFEAIKITMEPITTEDLTKVWTALTTPYRLSAAYTVNVVQIESGRRPAPAARVGEARLGPAVAGGGGATEGGEGGAGGRRILVMAHEPPELESVMVLRPGEEDGDAPHVGYAAIGDRLVLRGRHFGRPPSQGQNPTRVHVGPVALTPTDDRHGPDRIIVELPDDAKLQPGPYQVHVTLDHDGGYKLSSNRRPGLVVPYVAHAAKATVQAPAADADPEDEAPPLSATQVMVVTGTRLFAPDVPCRTILQKDDKVLDVQGNDYVRGASGPGYTEPEGGKIAIRVPAGLDPVGMRVRVLVDGHENLPRDGLVVEEGP